MKSLAFLSKETRVAHVRLLFFVSLMLLNAISLMKVGARETQVLPKHSFPLVVFPFMLTVST